MREYEEFEGLRGVAVDDANGIEEPDDDSNLGSPINAAVLTSGEVFYEVFF
jgi:hypothetical protein